MASCYSVVVPIFNEAEVLPTLYQRLRKVMEAVGEPYELIFVNDGSTDQSPGLLLDLRAQDPCVKVVSFSRNFGHQIAITAGLDYSSGDAVIVRMATCRTPPRSSRSWSRSGEREMRSSSR